MIAPADPSNTRSNLLILNRIISYRSAHTASCCSNSVLISAVVIRFLLIAPQYRCCLVFYDWRFFVKRRFFNNYSFTHKLIAPHKSAIRHHNKRCSSNFFSIHLITLLLLHSTLLRYIAAPPIALKMAAAAAPRDMCRTARDFRLLVLR